MVMKKRTLIIAEVGVNHNGDMGLAKSLIEHAAKAGADIVKFQTFNADRLVTRTATKANYQNMTTDKQESQHGMLRRLELTRKMHDDLISHCAQHQISFLSTAFDIESVNLLDSLGQTMFKIPSGEITNLPYLRHIARMRRSIILSTGMASLGDVEAALDALERAGTLRSQVTLLHCTTEYPTPMAEVNLRAMQTLKDAFGVSVGYSDHTIGLEVSIAAVALGASIIEKHFTLDRSLPGPDHQASLEPDALKTMISAIRNVEVALGDGIKRATSSEGKNMAVMRKSLVACQPIKTGESFTETNMTAKRPGTGLSPMRWDEVIGKRATKDFAVDELLEL